MSKTVITVENLSKKYRIRHEPQHERYKALRDVLADQAKRLLRFRRAAVRDNWGGPEDFWALQDVSFAVKEGEVVGIIGRNGAGKSTLLKTLSRVTDPTHGRIKISGRVASLLEVGTGFHPELTGRENIFLNGAILGMTKKEIRAKFDEIVDFAEIEKFLDTPVKRYSSGMYMRLAFAVAAHLESEILIVDEVLAVGDSQFQQKCLGRMGDVARGGRTVLFVSHNIAAVLALTRRCILLRDGHIGLDGNTVETTEEYLKSWQDRQTEEYSNASRPSAEHGAKIRIERIAIVGASAPSFKFGDPIGLRVSIRSTINKEGLFFGLTMESTSSIPILTGASDNVVAARAGSVISYEITLSDSRLSPGHYVLHLSVADGSLTTGRRTYDLIRPGPTFTVEPLGEATGTIFNWDQRAFGSIVHPGSAISVRILAPSEGPIGSLDVKQVNADPMWNRRESIRL